MGHSRQTTVRKLAIQLLYQFESDALPDLEAQAMLYLESSESEKRTQALSLPLALDAWAYKHTSDTAIQRHAINWNLDRLNRIDHAIMRLAIYEIDVLKKPVQIIIDEAVGLAKKFSGEEAYKFVNGILGGYVRHV